MRLGDFTLKSGRRSPYFFDTGAFSSGRALRRLGEFYAAAILESGLTFDMLFGPAYKGITLVAGVSIALSERWGKDCPFCCNRKETKEHGEGGELLGAKPRGRVLILDDVLTAGTSVRASIALLRRAGAEPAGVAVALDRQEADPRGAPCAEGLERQGLAMIRIVTLDTLIACLEEKGDDVLGVPLRAIREYRRGLA